MNNSLTLAANAAVTMSSREIAGLTGKRHDNVMRDIRIQLMMIHFYEQALSHLNEEERKNVATSISRIERVLFAKIVHIPSSSNLRTENFGFILVQNGSMISEILLDKDNALTLVSGYDVRARSEIIKRWQELESKNAPAVALPDFTNPAESARAWALQYEEREKAQAALALAAPKVQFFDKVVERSTLMTATQVGQKLGMSAMALNKHLDELDVYSKNIKRARVFKQWFVDKGYGELKQTELGHSQPLFTTSGEAWIIERMVSEGYSVSLENV